MPRALAAVDVQDLARHEGGLLEVQHGVDDVPDVAQPAERMQTSQRIVGGRVVHGCLHYTECNDVGTNSLVRVFNSQCPGGGVEPALGQRSQCRRHLCVGVVDETGGDRHDVAAV